MNEMSPPTPAPFDSPIEDYLDELLAACLPGRVRETRHLLAETEAHLRDSATDAEARGLDPHAAEADAVARFGPAAALAAAERAVQTTSLRDLARQCTSSGLLMAAIGGIAVGVSGLFALVMDLVAGGRFLVDPPAGSALSASNCARWLAGAQHGTTCVQAGLSDWASDTILVRLAAGFAGVIALLSYFVARRWWSRRGTRPGLPPVVVETAAVLAFGAAGVWLAGLGIDRVVIASGHGSGQWLSAAPVALAIAIVFGVKLVGDLRRSAGTRLAADAAT